MRSVLSRVVGRVIFLASGLGNVGCDEGKSAILPMKSLIPACERTLRILVCIITLLGEIDEGVLYDI
jgi:hypothetical protein